MLFGTIFLTIGIFLLLSALGIMTGNLWNYFWALLFIVFGLKIIFRRKGKGCCSEFMQFGQTIGKKCECDCDCDDDHHHHHGKDCHVSEGEYKESEK